MSHQTSHRHLRHTVAHHSPAVATPVYTVKGIDVSQWNVEAVSARAFRKMDDAHKAELVDHRHHHMQMINWQQVKTAGYTFAFAKSSEGLSATDWTFTHNWPAMKAAGLIRGAFHFGRPDLGKPVDQAKFFHRVVNPGKGDLPLVLDFERRKDNLPYHMRKTQLWDWAKAFLAEIQRLTKRPGILYSGPFIREDAGNPADNLNCPLWLPAVVHDPSRYVPKAWKPAQNSKDPGWTFWQWAEMKATSGVPNGAEQDYFKGSLADLQSLTYP